MSCVVSHFPIISFLVTLTVMFNFRAGFEAQGKIALFQIEFSEATFYRGGGVVEIPKIRLSSIYYVMFIFISTIEWKSSVQRVA